MAFIYDARLLEVIETTCEIQDYNVLAQKPGVIFHRNCYLNIFL
jgi:hypothetical protein